MVNGKIRNGSVNPRAFLQKRESMTKQSKQRYKLKDAHKFQQIQEHASGLTGTTRKTTKDDEQDQNISSHQTMV